MGHSRGDCHAPVVLRPSDDVGEILVEKQIMEFRIAFVGFLDSIQKFRADDATAPPDRGDIAKVQVPVRPGAGRAEQFHSLRIRNDLRSVKRVAHRRDQGVPVTGELRHRRLRQDFR